MVWGQAYPELLSQGQTEEASREGDSRYMDGCAKSFYALQEEPRFWCQPVCPSLGLWHMGSSNWLKGSSLST